MSSEALLAPGLGDRVEFDSWLHAPDKEAGSQVALASDTHKMRISLQKNMTAAEAKSHVLDCGNS
jgi:hypothetical protein